MVSRIDLMGGGDDRALSHYRAVIQAIDGGAFLFDRAPDRDGLRDYRYLATNRPMQAMLGTGDLTGQSMRACFPDEAESWYDDYDHVLTTGQPRRIERAVVYHDLVIEMSIARLDHDGGHVLLAIMRDITARVSADDALRASGHDQAVLIDGVPQLVWRAATGGLWTWASQQWCRYTGQTEHDSFGLGWLDPLHPDDRADAMARWAEAGAIGTLNAAFRIRRVADGQYRWFQTRAAPIRDEDGAILEWIGTSTDIDDIRRLQHHQQHLLGELQHRVRNILTVVRSVFTRTVEAQGTLDDVADHFRGRLDALARRHVVATRSVEGDVDLEDLIRDELLSVGVSDGPALALEGPPVLLPGPVADTIALTIHELVTNAVKFGAFKTEDGRLTIRWSTNMDRGGQQRLALTWSEQGVAALPIRPVRKGFGMELIEEALPYRFGAETMVEFRGGGIRCHIDLPLSDRRWNG